MYGKDGFLYAYIERWEIVGSDISSRPIVLTRCICKSMEWIVGYYVSEIWESSDLTSTLTTTPKARKTRHLQKLVLISTLLNKKINKIRNKIPHVILRIWIGLYLCFRIAWKWLGFIKVFLLPEHFLSLYSAIITSLDISCQTDGVPHGRVLPPSIVVYIHWQFTASRWDVG